MTEGTRILTAIAQGDPLAAAQLLPLVYDALRQLAVLKLAQEKPGQTPRPPALAHGASLRRVAGAEPAARGAEQNGDSRGPFSPAAAEAMRRTLVEGARRK